MRRSVAGWLVARLRGFLTSQRYPTRTVEHAFAWIVIVWSWSVLTHPEMLDARAYAPMIQIMTASAWGWAGMVIGLLRVLAIIVNGRWHSTPELRLLGAIWGMMFWIALSYCNWIAVADGATDFPMRRALFVLIIFEIYSCYRCGQDIGRRHHQVRSDSNAPSRLMGAGYG